jgi:geranylgeranyl reductase family protein
MKEYTQKFDAVVVGAGPAGASSAIIFGQNGISTALLDKKDFPRDKTCGDGITYKAKADLIKLGVFKEIEKSAPFKVNGYSLIFSNNSQLKFEFADDNESQIYIISRNIFDNILLKKAMSFESVQFLPKTEIKKISDEHTGVITKDNTTISGKTIIDATGYNSILGQHNKDLHKNAWAVRGYYENLTGLDKTIEIYFTSSVSPGYFWIFPTSETSANVGCGTFINIVEKKSLNLKAILKDFIENHPIASKKFKNATLQGRIEGGKIPLAFGDFNWSRVTNNLISIGDAGGFVNPITAEGISYAIKTGILAAEVISKAIRNDKYTEEELKKFDILWHKEFSNQYKSGDIYTESFSKELISKYFISNFQKNFENKDLSKVSDVYEYMIKLKVIAKSLR